MRWLIVCAVLFLLSLCSADTPFAIGTAIFGAVVLLFYLYYVFFADRIKEREHRLMLEELHNGVYSLTTHDRLFMTGIRRIQIEASRLLSSDLPFTVYTLNNSHEINYLQLGIDCKCDFMINNHICPLVLHESLTPIDVRNHHGYVLAESVLLNPIYLKLKVQNPMSLHEDFIINIDKDGYLKTTDFLNINKNNFDEDIDSRIDALSLKTYMAERYIEKATTPDTVFCLKCESWPSQLKTEFLQRPRKNNWPSTELLNRLTNLDLLVVPAGRSDDVSKEVEWKLSFSVMENELLEKLDQPYIECITALESFKSEYFNSTDSENLLCTYFIKTACLWKCEQDQHSNKENLMTLIKKVLGWVIDCYEERNFPHYFFPKYNLIGNLSAQLCYEVQQKLIALHTDLWMLMMKRTIGEMCVHMPMEHLSELCRELSVPIDTDNSSIESRLFHGLLHHPNAREVIQLCINVLQLKRGYSKPTDVPFWVGPDIGCLFTEIESLIKSGVNHVHILNLPGQTIIKLLHKVNEIVPEDYAEMFRQYLFWHLGDVCAYLVFYLRSKVSAEKLAQLYDFPIHHYNSIGVIVFPHDRNDQAIISIVSQFKYHYLFGNYGVILQNMIPDNLKEDTDFMNHLPRIVFNKRSYLCMESLSADEKLRDLVLTSSDDILFVNPVVLLFYIKARVYLITKYFVEANAMINDMKLCWKNICASEDQKVTRSLIKIVKKIRDGST